MTKINKTKENKITQEYLLNTFFYSNGHLFNKRKRGRLGLPKERAGTLSRSGYQIIGVKGNRYLEHRLIWLYHKGKFPDGILDHINRDKQDSRIENLREVTHSINNRNTNLRPDNKHGIKGLYWHSRDKKWMVCFRKDKKLFHYGYFTDKKYATQVAKKKLKEFMSNN